MGSALFYHCSGIYKLDKFPAQLREEDIVIISFSNREIEGQGI